MQQLRGMPVASAIIGQIAGQIEELAKKQIIPKLAIVRIGEREEDVSYEKGIIKRFSAANAMVETIAMPREPAQGALEETITKLNGDDSVHGILLFRPLPGHLPFDRIRGLIAKTKDVDAMSPESGACIYEGRKDGYAPCTAQAVIELLDFYGIELTGKKTTIIGRSLIVGKPLAMLLLDKNATVTICHTKTQNLAEECKKADILVACAGSAKMVGADFAHPGQIIIDVGVNMAEGKLCGDADYEALDGKVLAMTPVPGGVGAVTTSVLLKNTVHSAHLCKPAHERHVN
ncbi:MAG: bifunctional 5,10-methylenetetrahydrofolate dehydrogenase/5,10-methenyltetrahydrofolate cyclohydrolase [Oscillospiraceae bacterium]|nr:bifunctional 5,10-methylenetetrahydrofolate dehydrogenase/5,10-methenyltetrahydrofolate cyclohydrolase [Oscillospiraceae bacterium]